MFYCSRKKFPFNGYLCHSSNLINQEKSLTSINIEKGKFHSLGLHRFRGPWYSESRLSALNN